MPRLTVLVPVDDLDRFRAVMASLDLQTAESSDFDVIVVPPADAGVEARRPLELAGRIARHRRNVRVSPTGATAAAMAEVGTEFVIVLDRGVRLAATALDRLLERATVSSALGVVGHVVGAVPAAELWRDGDLIEADRIRGSVTIRRSNGALDQDTSQTIEVLGGGALGTPAPLSVASDLDLTSADLRWAGGELELTLDTPPSWHDVERVALLARRETDGCTWLREIGRVSPSTARTLIDPLELGRLSDYGSPGAWGLELLGSSGGEVRRRALAARPTPPAFRGPWVMVLGDRGGRLVLDVGATRFPATGGIDVAGADVHESARGSLLVLPLPHCHVVQPVTVSASLALDDSAYSAILHTDDVGVRIEGYLSGVPGTRALGVRLGPHSGHHRTGVSLTIDGLGGMTLVSTPPPVQPLPSADSKGPGATPTKPTTPTAPASRAQQNRPAPRTGWLADARRAVPRRLHPLAEKIAANRTARRIYRRLTRSGQG